MKRKSFFSLKFSSSFSTSTLVSSSISSFEQFSSYYSSLYGANRWNESLYPSLTQPIQYCAIVNKYAHIDDRNLLLGIDDTNMCSQFVKEYEYGYYHIKNEQLRKLFEQHQQNEEVNVKEEKDEINYNDNKEGKEFNTNNKEKHDHSMNISLHDEQDHSQQLQQLHDDEESCDSEIDLKIHQKEILYHWPSPSLPSSLDRNNLYCYYPLDGASIFPILALNLTSTSNVFDMCAAPGGKSLIILSYLNLLSGGKLTGCDISTSRRHRLFHTLQNYLPSELFSSLRLITGNAASPQLYHQHQLFNQYDRILVDAPCSSERHLILQHLSSNKGINWSLKRSKLNSERQRSLLFNALKICLIPGRVVYSTCSLNILENDEVVMKVVQQINKKFLLTNDEEPLIPQVRILENHDSFRIPCGEKTPCGWIILPDQCGGMGPIYFSTMEVVYQDRNEVIQTHAHDQQVKKEKMKMNKKCKDRSKKGSSRTGET